MPPSTKNLRERMDGILADLLGCEVHTLLEDKHYDTARYALLSILSSELSLAIKGLREAVSKPMDEYLDKTYLYEVLEAFDSKAKEILGVLTHED